MVKKCLIEIGSNTIKLFIADINNNNQISPIENKRRMTLLAKGLGNNGKLSIESKNQTIAYLEEYLKICNSYNIDPSNILVNATAACRDASDGHEFINTIKKEFKLNQVKILSGEEEAKYTFLGTLKSIPLDNNLRYCVIDIGGGSFQLSIGEKDHFEYGKSFPIGCNGIAEQFKLKEIIPENIVDNVIEYIYKHKLEGFNIPDFTIKAFGAGGTIKITQIMLKSKNDYTPIMYDELLNIAYLMAGLSIEERFNWFKQKYTDDKFRLDAGLTIDRAEIYLAGVCIYLGILKKLSLKEINLSSTDAKDYLIRSPYSKIATNL